MSTSVSLNSAKPLEVTDERNNRADQEIDLERTQREVENWTRANRHHLAQIQNLQIGRIIPPPPPELQGLESLEKRISKMEEED